MATRVRAVPVDDDEGLTAETAVQVMRTNPPDEEPEQSEEESIVEQMKALMAEVPSAVVRIKLYKLPKPGSGKSSFEWCEDFNPMTFQSLDWQEIRARWGAGTFQLRLIGPRGVVKSQTVEIAAPSYPLMNPAQPATGHSEIGAVLQALAENQARMLEAITQRPKETDQLRETLALMAAMREAMGLTAAPAAAPNPMEMMKEVFAMVREAKSAAKELADETPPADPDDPMAMVGKLLPLITAAVQQPQAQPVPALQIPPAIARPISAPFPPTDQPAATVAPVAHNPVSQPVTNEGPQEMTPAQIMIGIHIGALQSMARAGIAPDIGGEYIAANLPDDLLEHIDNPQAVDMVLNAFPILKPYESWARAAFAEAKKILDEELGPDGSPELGNDSAPNSLTP